MGSPLIKSPLEMLYDQAGIPHMQAGGSPPPIPPAAMRFMQMMGGLGNRNENPVQGYRADPTGRYGGKDRMETQPTTFNRDTIADFVKAMRAGESFGIPQLTQQQLAQMLLTEGRSDFGFNMLNENNKRAVQKAELLQEMGHNRLPADFAAALYDKQQTANRINRPLQEVWNGVGLSLIHI